MIWYNGPDMGLRIKFATQIMSKKYILLQVYLFMIR